MEPNNLVNKYELNLRKEYAKTKKSKLITMLVIFLLVIIMTFVCLFVGSSNMSIGESFMALFRQGDATNIRIMWNIRVPRILAALLAGSGLAISGLIMQTTLGNVMASPSTLGVSNAAVFGANLSIIAFAGGFLSLGNNVQDFSNGANPYATSLMAFIFSFISILVILGLCRLKDFSPNTVVLAGIAIGSVWTAGTTFLQFFATDVGLSAATVWNFGDLGRATYETDLIMAVVVIVGVVFFAICSWKYNALLGGDMVANSLGIHVNVLRFISLLLSSLITAVCVSFLGIIGFVGIIAPHSMKRILGNDHRYTIPSSIMAGSLLLLVADTLSRGIGNGTALPVGAITSLIGAPFFLYLIFSNRRKFI
jgi:iron complex transport system permease protein